MEMKICEKTPKKPKNMLINLNNKPNEINNQIISKNTQQNFMISLKTQTLN